jgi:hypothetical protein
MADFRTADPQIIDTILRGAEKKKLVEAKEVITTMDGAEIGSFLISDESGENAIMVFKDTEGSCIKTESGDKDTVLAKKNEFRLVTQGVAEIMQGKKPAAVPVVPYTDQPMPTTPVSLLESVSGSVTTGSWLKNNRYAEGYSFTPDIWAYYDFAFTISGDILLQYQGDHAINDTYRAWLAPDQAQTLKFVSSVDFGVGSFTLQISRYLQYALNGDVNVSSGTATLKNIVPGNLPDKIENFTDGDYNFMFEAGQTDESWQLEITAPGYADYQSPVIPLSEITLSTGKIHNVTLTALQINTTDVSITDVSDSGSEYNGSFPIASTYLYCGFDGDIDNSWILYRNVGIPQGANIVSAELTVQEKNNIAGPVNLKISAEKTENADKLLNWADWNSAVRTTEFAEWTLNNLIAGSFYSSADFAAVVQEIVSQPGWVSGNNLLILIDDNGTDQGSTNNYCSFQNQPSTFQTTLRIRWTE